MPDGAEAAAAAIDALIARIREATRRAVADETALVESAAKSFAPVMTGTLRRSILPTPTHPLAPSVFEALVGPTVVYGRQKELGGHIRPVRAPELVFFWLRQGRWVHTQHVYQHPQPFMKPGVEQASGRFGALIERRVGAAILSI